MPFLSAFLFSWVSTQEYRVYTIEERILFFIRLIQPMEDNGGPSFKVPFDLCANWGKIKFLQILQIWGHFYSQIGETRN